MDTEGLIMETPTQTLPWNSPKLPRGLKPKIKISFQTSEEDLREFFSKYGSVRDARIIRDRAEVSKG